MLSECQIHRSYDNRKTRKPSFYTYNRVPSSQSKRVLAALTVGVKTTYLCALDVAGLFFCNRLRGLTSRLGAYPNSRVLWSIHVENPALSADDPRLKDIAAFANCLMSGMVRLNFAPFTGTRELIVATEAVGN
jgi:hypothetical protein